MKRLALLTITIALALFFLLPACGGSGGSGGSDYSVVGAWQVTNINGIAVPKNTLVFVFNGNGTGSVSGLGQTESFNWAQSGNTLTLTGGGDTDTITLNWISTSKVQITIDGDVFILERA